MGWSGGNGGQGKGPHVHSATGTDGGDGSGLLVQRQGTTKGLMAGDLGSGIGRLSAREARRGGGGGEEMNEDEWSPLPLFINQLGN